MTIETILDLYDEGVRNIILYGPPGTGKTYTITGPNMLLSKLAEKTITATAEHGFEDILPLRYDYMNQKPSEAEEAAEEEVEADISCQGSVDSFHSNSGEPWEFSEWKDSDGQVFEWQSKIHYEILQFHASYDYSDFMMGGRIRKERVTQKRIQNTLPLCNVRNPQPRPFARITYR